MERGMMIKKLGVAFLAVTVQAEAAPCTLCPNGAAMQKPDYVIKGWLGFDVSCAQIATVVPIYIPDESDELCTKLQRFSSLCGCPTTLPDSAACHMCDKGSNLTQLHKQVQEGDDVETCDTCECIQAFALSLRSGGHFCHLAQELGNYCGCRPSANNNNSTSVISGDERRAIATELFGGTHTTIKPKVDLYTSFFGTSVADENSCQICTLITCARIGAALSLVGAIAVFQDISRGIIRRSHLYNQIIAAMAVVDMFYAVAVGLQQIPRPTDHLLSYGVHGVYGNTATCKAQGWFIQWSAMTSLFLNCSLTTYFVLVVVYRAKTAALRKVQRQILGVPLVLGLLIACCSLPIIGPDVRGCYLAPPHPRLVLLLEMTGPQTSWVYYSFSYLVPGGVGVIYNIVGTVWIMLHMRKINTNAIQWSMSASIPGGGTSQRTGRRRILLSKSMRKLENEVAWQSFLYFGALSCTWVIFFCVSPNPGGVYFKHYRLWLVISILMPMQGLFNCLAYFRPRAISAMGSMMQKWTTGRQIKNGQSFVGQSPSRAIVTNVHHRPVVNSYGWERKSGEGELRPSSSSCDRSMESAEGEAPEGGNVVGGDPLSRHSIVLSGEPATDLVLLRSSEEVTEDNELDGSFESASRLGAGSHHGSCASNDSSVVG